MTQHLRAEAVEKNTPLAPESVHLTLLAQAQEQLIDKALEERMELAQRISSLTHSLRKKSVLKVRQPLQRILVPVLNDSTKEQVGKVEDLICAEVNVKHVEFLDDTSGVLVKSVKPNFKRLGASAPAELQAAVQRFGDYIREEVQALRLDFVPELADGTVLEFDDFKVPAKVEVVTA
uniref:Uncharacterized protein n=1 Tax=Tanacetum cinerariifolium TaxID=118510 RepID=A0A699QTX4_TANCI|nr:hypothetical protein [Tanacetum cinerariifolium]